MPNILNMQGDFSYLIFTVFLLTAIEEEKIQFSALCQKIYLGCLCTQYCESCLGQVGNFICSGLDNKSSWSHPDFCHLSLHGFYEFTKPLLVKSFPSIAGLDV